MMRFLLSILSILTGIAFLNTGCQPHSEQEATVSYFQRVSTLLGDSILQGADQQLSAPIVTVTAHECP